MLCAGATFVKKNSCIVARIVSFDTADLHLSQIDLSQIDLSHYILH